MSLILAIEPDRRQVAQLISIVRRVAGAELVLADTTERALESIGNGVPDLILVPALLSPQDDAALAAALRVIATAAHVQMLTIPTFATAKPRPKSRGVLSAFRRSTKEAPLDGCDPAVFAEQISSYLERAKEERANEERAAALALDDYAEAAQADPFIAPTQAPDDFLAATLESADPPVMYAESWTAAAEPSTQTDVREVEASAFLPEPVLEELPTPFESAALVLEQAPAERWMSAVLETEIAADPLPPAPVLDASISTLELTGPPVSAFVPVVPVIDVAHAEPLPQIRVAADPPPPAMALDEFVATLERIEPVAVDAYAQPLAVAFDAGPEHESVEIDIDLTSELNVAPSEAAIVADPPVAPAPALDEWLADFERADLPVIQEVRAEQWMVGAPAEPEQVEQDENEPEQDDIDLSTELEAVLHAEEPAGSPERAVSLKPFEAVVPIERFEPFPLAAWQSWPRLEGTVAEANGENTSGTTDDVTVADVNPFAEFEADLHTAEPLERFEPVVPVHAFEPLPLAAWQNWPRLEGVAAEAYEEPIAPRKAVARPEWVELMRSLREDIARRRTELAQPVPAVQLKSPPPRHKTAQPAPVAEPAIKRVKRTRPIEDEWGLFDPEQCGFAALLDKLDEMTGPPGSPDARRRI